MIATLACQDAPDTPAISSPPIQIKSHLGGPPEPPLRYFHETAFDNEPVPAPETPSSLPKASKAAPDRGANLPAYFARLYEVELLDKEQERQCFRQLNYLKYLSDQERLRHSQGISGKTGESRIANLNAKVCDARNRIVEANLRLVVSLARKLAASSQLEFDDLIGPGNAALIRAVDLFDYRLGYRFSTYAYRAIQRTMLTEMSRQTRRKQLFVTFDHPSSETVEKDAAASSLQELHASEARRTVYQLLDSLDDRDQKIVMHRFGIEGGNEGRSFSKIAKEVGLSTTRTIQLFNRSMERMRAVLERQPRLEPKAECIEQEKFLREEPQ